MAVTHRTDTEPPLTVRWATGAWFVAVGSGVAESVVGVIGAVGDGTPVVPLVAQVAFRAIVYGALFVVIDRFFRRGVRWSRWVLAGLLGTVGLASLLIGPVHWFRTNGNPSTLTWSAEFVAFAVIRSIHVIAILTALTLTCHPDTNRWFRHP